MATCSLAAVLTLVTLSIALAAPGGMRGAAANGTLGASMRSDTEPAANASAVLRQGDADGSAPPEDESADGQPATAALSAIAAVTGGKNIKILYHQTSREIAHLIYKGGFRPGSYGWCGGAIYFATSPGDTNKKAIGDASHTGYVIAAKVNVGRVMDMPSTCDKTMTGARLQEKKFDSIRFNPGDGEEYVIYSPYQILATWHAK